jgi:hypothetical protein
MSTLVHEKISETLKSSLGLSYPAVSVAFSSNGVSAPAYSGKAPAGCVFWQEAFEGPIKTTAEDHQSCAIGVYTHNMSEAPANYEQQLGAVMSVLGELEYVRPADMPNIPCVGTVEVRHLQPCWHSGAAPEVVLLFANARQGLVITEAVQQVENAWPVVLGPAGLRGGSLHGELGTRGDEPGVLRRARIRGANDGRCRDLGVSGVAHWRVCGSDRALSKANEVSGAVPSDSRARISRAGRVRRMRSRWRG